MNEVEQDAPEGLRVTDSLALRLSFILGLGLLGASMAVGFVEAFTANDWPPLGSRDYQKVARAHMRAGDYEAALAEYHAEQRLNHQPTGASVQLYLILQELGRTDAALDALRIGAERQLHSDAHRTFADALASAGRQAEAVGILQKAVGFDGKNAQLRVELGKALIGIGEVEAAKAELDGALEVDPTLAEARFLLSELQKEARRREAERASTSIESGPS